MEAAPDRTQPAARDARRPRDMVVAMLVLVAPIVLLLAFHRVLLDGEAPITTDAAPTIARARAAQAFVVAEPVGLDPDKWRVVSARFDNAASDGSRLRLGYVGPDNEPVQLVQSDADTTTLLPAELGAKARAEAPVTVASRPWQRYATTRGEAALVLMEPGRTIIVIGHAGPERLQELAAALR